MNCEQGDLAVIVNAASERSQVNIGFITRCIKFLPDPNGVPAWIVDPPPPSGPYFDEVIGCMRIGNWIYDRNLKPIRDPGDDATDETLLWLPSPSRTKEEA